MKRIFLIFGVLVFVWQVNLAQSEVDIFDDEIAISLLNGRKIVELSYTANKSGELKLRNQNDVIRAKLSALEGRLELFSLAGNLRAKLDEGIIDLYNGNNMKTFTLDSDASGNASYLILYDNDGETKVRLDADDAGNGGYMEVNDNGGNPRIRFFGEEHTGNGSTIYMYNGSGEKTIEIDADVSGDGRVSTDELEIVGGSDLAENFDIPDHNISLSAGMVVSIDPFCPGKLMISVDEYDKKVAGVVSGANGIKPGMRMGQKQTIADGDTPVALVGRVYVLADAEYGTISPGDMLTTSKTPGHAMCVKNYQMAHGAILGKAMTGLKKGQGFVLMLVNLQ